MRGVFSGFEVTLGDSADLTVTPYVSASRTTTLGLRYRQAFTNGATEWTGAISRDDIEDGTRGYLFGAARFRLPRDYLLGLQVQTASDRGYLLDYDITDADRLWSGITLDRVAAAGTAQAAFPDRILNTHPALLPAFPGAHGVRDALAYGVTVTGSTAHLDDSGVDTGPIIEQRTVAIAPDDTEETLHERIKVVEREMLVDVVTAMATGGWRVEGRRVHVG